MTPYIGDIYFQYLSDEEFIDPYKVCCDFIDFFELPYARKLISRWMQSADKNGSLPHGLAGELLCMYERFCHLLEAAWQISERDNNDRPANVNNRLCDYDYDLMNTRLYCSYFRLGNPWMHFPRSLSRKEYINPYRVFRKVFRYMSLADWKTTLHTLLHTSLNDHHMEDTDDHFNIVTIKLLLDKLLDAAQLISVREFKDENGKTIPIGIYA
jgi:hypothetical protein